MQARAPSANARIMSDPVRMPPSNNISVSEPTASATFGSAEIEEGAPSSWRPPWFDTTMASAPSLTAVLVSSASNTLQDQLARPDLLDPLHVFPTQRRIELRPNPGRQRIDVGRVLHVAGQIAEGLALALENAPGPSRLRRDVDDVLDADFRR